MSVAQEGYCPLCGSSLIRFQDLVYCPHCTLSVEGET